MIDLLEIINNQINRNIYHGASLALLKMVNGQNIILVRLTVSLL